MNDEQWDIREEIAVGILLQGHREITEDISLTSGKRYRWTNFLNA
jgi:hypothetical protein